MKVIFFDVDGVLNSEEYLNSVIGINVTGIAREVDMEKVKLLKQAVNKTGAKVVMTSSIRLSPIGRDLKEVLQREGMLVGVTPFINEERGKEIKAWIKMNGGVEDFVILDDETLIRIFCVLIENYPENISLNTIKYYQIFDFVKYISRLKSQYSENALALCRLNFDEYLSNEVYNFDLDKDLKNELRDIVQYLKTLNIDFKGLREEIINNFSSYHFEISLKVINEYKLVEYAQLLADLVNENRLSLDYLCQCVQVLKTLEKTELIKKDVVKNIDNSNIRAFIEHCCH